MAFDYGAYGRSNLSASSPTDQELDYHYGLSLEEWARDKPLSILQLDPADRAVLRIAAGVRDTLRRILLSAVGFVGCGRAREKPGRLLEGKEIRPMFVVIHSCVASASRLLGN
ncbi:hypothetical protein DAPPUDRAFT_97928 [Daphnia pulex]|uniref:Uncharacterized protein n=1 Tax=Daphnia pulex TaxID=6669 RepID=E9G2Y2_DAPPU|nr:hypothetical protein DAPPUDRAFT_97928 [Daphnia pulex]|eukprot:EFX86425.1 hypothetical protein DAPPUDRAFT_97928 [Daphnia pulex]